MKIRNVGSDTYIGQDPWARRGLHVEPGVEVEVSDEKWGQLQRDYPGRFEVVVERAPEVPVAVSEPEDAPPKRGRRARA